MEDGRWVLVCEPRQPDWATCLRVIAFMMPTLPSELFGYRYRYLPWKYPSLGRPCLAGKHYHSGQGQPRPERVRNCLNM